METGHRGKLKANINTLPATKESTTVLLNTENFIRKYEELLDLGSYELLKKDLTQSRFTPHQQSRQVFDDIKKCIARKNCFPMISWFTQNSQDIETSS